MPKHVTDYILFQNHNYQGGLCKFIYKTSILDNKQLLSNMKDWEVTQVPYTTRIAFLADSYILWLNFPAILCIIAIASYITIIMKTALLNKNLK